MADSDKDLTIRLKLDKTQATAESAKFHTEVKGQIAETARVSDAAEQARAEAAQRGKQTRLQAAAAVQTAEQQTARAITDAQTKLTRTIEQESRKQGKALASVNAPAGELNDLLAGSVASYFGLQAVGKVLEEIGGNIGKVYQRATQLADEFIAKRAQLREVADIIGNKGGATRTFTVEQAKFETATGMKPEEAIGFRKAFYGGAASAIGEGKNLSKDEGKKFEEMAAAWAVAKGVDADVAGQLAAAVVKMEGFQAKGQGAEEALARLNRSFAVLKAGAGDNPVLMRQLAMLAASSTNEDAMKGVFSNLEETAVAVSVGAEKHDAQSAELMKGAIRGMRRFDDKKAGPLLKEAGVTPQTPFFEAIAKITPVVEAEATSRGVKTQDVLDKYFESNMEAEGIAVAINRGISGKVIRDRFAAAAEAGGAEQAKADVKEFQESPEGPGPELMAQAKGRELDVTKGAKLAQVQTLRKQAENELKKEGWSDSTVVAVNDAIADTILFPLRKLGVTEGASEGRLHRRMIEMVEQRRRAAGLAPNERTGLNSLSGSIDEDLAKQLTEIQAAGQNPLKEAAQPPIGPGRAPAPPRTWWDRLTGAFGGGDSGASADDREAKEHLRVMAENAREEMARRRQEARGPERRQPAAPASRSERPASVTR